MLSSWYMQGWKHGHHAVMTAARHEKFITGFGLVYLIGYLGYNKAPNSLEDSPDYNAGYINGMVEAARYARHFGMLATS